MKERKCHICKGIIVLENSPFTYWVWNVGKRKRYFDCESHLREFYARVMSVYCRVDPDSSIVTEKIEKALREGILKKVEGIEEEEKV